MYKGFLFDLAFNVKWDRRFFINCQVELYTYGKISFIQENKIKKDKHFNVILFRVTIKCLPKMV